MRLKSILYIGLCIVLGVDSGAQTFLTASGSHDTASDFLRSGNADVVIDNPIRSASGNPIYIKTTVQAINVPAGVLFAPQFCDNVTCTNPTVGTIYRSAAYTGPALYHVTFPNMVNAPANSIATLKVLAEDTINGFSRQLTFLAWKPSLGVTRTLVTSDEVSVFPNPAREAVNVIYDEDMGIKKIAIYNLIGKAVQTYIPMDNKSAKLSLDNMPAGVYFIRLMNGEGQVMATRRFNRQ